MSIIDNFFKVSKKIKIIASNEMRLEVVRYSSTDESTIGALFDVTKGRKFLCYTLEDPPQIEKIPGRTRIPAGTYDMRLRSEGGFHRKYTLRFGKSFHKGMLHIQNVPNFKWILVHCGNTQEDTSGCLLLGDVSYNNTIKNGLISQSESAYHRIYPILADHLIKDGIITITYVDYDNN